MTGRRKLITFLWIIICAILGISSTVRAVNRHVPSPYRTIQAAINAANNGDTVIVADGIYKGEGNRDIDFKGKAITVKSENGPEGCIIDCEGYRNSPHRGFNFHTNEGRDSVVDGFKIINGYVYTDGKVNSFGSGIICNESNPTIRNCWIVVTAGEGISILGSPRISSCRITGSKTAIKIYKSSSAGEPPIIENNILNCTYGIYLFPWPRNLIIRNNVIVGTDLDIGFGIQYREHSALATITGNIITHFRNGIDFTYNSLESQRKALITYNNVWGNTNNFYMYEGNKTWQMAGVQGNISLDPMFVDPANGDFRLKRGSGCIDAGCDAGVYEDMEGNVRPWDYPGVDNNGALPEFDMGAYEFVNKKPIADAGEDQTVYAGPEGLAQVMLDGSGSYDPEGDELTYHWSWTIDGQTFTSSGADGIVNMRDFAVWVKGQQTQLGLEPPPFTGGAKKVGISDLAGFSQTWLSNLGQANWNMQYDTAPESPYLTIELPFGVHVVSLIVNDGIEDSEPDEVVITILDNTPPEFTLTVEPNMLWPPSHKMVLITPAWTVSDNCDPSPSVSLVSITMNEGDETDTYDPAFDTTRGDGHTINDIQVMPDGSIYLRAERSGLAEGRVYTLTFQAADESGNVAVQSDAVIVPHNQG